MISLLLDESPVIKRNYPVKRKSLENKILFCVMLSFLFGIGSGIFGGIYLSKAFPTFIDTILK